MKYNFNLVYQHINEGFNFNDVDDTSNNLINKLSSDINRLTLTCRDALASELGYSKKLSLFKDEYIPELLTVITGLLAKHLYNGIPYILENKCREHEWVEIGGNTHWKICYVIAKYPGKLSDNVSLMKYAAQLHVLLLDYNIPILRKFVKLITPDLFITIYDYLCKHKLVSFEKVYIRVSLDGGLFSMEIPLSSGYDKCLHNCDFVGYALTHNVKYNIDALDTNDIGLRKAVKSMLRDPKIDIGIFETVTLSTGYKALKLDITNTSSLTYKTYINTRYYFNVNWLSSNDIDSFLNICNDASTKNAIEMKLLLIKYIIDNKIYQLQDGDDIPYTTYHICKKNGVPFIAFSVANDINHSTILYITTLDKNIEFTKSGLLKNKK